MSMKQTVTDIIVARGCTPCGEYLCQVPMPLRGRRQDVDLCIADIVAALNAANINTVASCCGHGTQDGDIILEDGRELVIRVKAATGPLRGNTQQKARRE